MNKQKFLKLLKQVRQLSNAQRICLADAMFGAIEEDNYGQIVVHTNLADCGRNPNAVEGRAYREMKHKDYGI
jgi:hypothetical protein